MRISRQGLVGNRRRSLSLGAHIRILAHVPYFEKMKEGL
jgi:hypothetical protein